MPQKSKTIGIRLQPEVEKLLRAEASKHGMRPTTFAQKLVADTLTRTVTPVEVKLDAIQATLDRLERELPVKLRTLGGTQPSGNSAAGNAGLVSLRDWLACSDGGE